MAATVTAIDEGADDTRVEVKGAKCHDHKVGGHYDAEGAVVWENSRPLRAFAGAIVIKITERPVSGFDNIAVLPWDWLIF